MAIGVARQKVVPSQPLPETPSSLRLQQLVDSGTLYVAQNLSQSQFATLQAVASLVLQPNSKNLAAHLDSALASNASQPQPFTRPLPVAFDYQLGLDELDTIARTHTGYPFAELSTEIQDAILNLIATHDLTTRKLDLALWLEELHATAVATF